MRELAARNNLHSFRKGYDKVATIAIEKGPNFRFPDVNTAAAETSRSRGMLSRCASCIYGYSKYGDDVDVCKGQCSEGCDICEGQEGTIVEEGS